MLRDEVVTAVGEGRFHIWAIRTVDEGIEILTGAPAGSADATGVYSADTVNGRVAARLAELARRYQEFAETDEERRSFGWRHVSERSSMREESRPVKVGKP